MGQTTGIKWTDHTFNPWWGCAKVSSGCQLCYAETFDKRTGGAHWGYSSEGRNPLKYFGDKHWREPLKWNRDAEKAGERRKVFCASMADVFDDHADPAVRSRLWQLIRDTPHLDWQLLTKRPENITAMLPEDWGQGYPNVWLGTSVENQSVAQERIPILIAIPARVHFLSCEPLLGPVDLWEFNAFSQWDHRGSYDYFQSITGVTERIKVVHGIDWVIIGGESGFGARPMEVVWAISLIHQCEDAGCPVFFKQTGAELAKGMFLKHKKGEDPSEWPDYLQVQEFPTHQGESHDQDVR